MTEHFKNQGRSLLANGYLIVPIRKGEKRPALSAWQNARLGAGDLARYPGHGVGVLCGQGAHPIVGVDVDISHPVIGPGVIAWCQENLGDTAERVGAAPRVMLVYRASAAGWAKGSSVMFYDPTDPFKPSGKRNDQQVEILGLGQQFVAYHEHPDTHRDYEWVDLMGGLEHLRADDLPVITEAQIDALLAEVARLVRITAGITVSANAASPVYISGGDDDDLSSLVARTDVPIIEMQALMGYLDNEADDYDTWVHVGMALHHEYADTEQEDDALQLWRDYGSRSSKDEPSNYEFKWRSFGRRSSGAPTTLRWLLKIANLAKGEKDHGAKLEAIEQVKTLIKEQDDIVKLGSKNLLDKIRGLLPDDALLRDMAVSAMQTQHKVVTGNTLTVTKARSLLFGPRAATVQAKRPLTEFGNAERMLDRYGNGLMYVPELDGWFIWTGIYWRRAVDVEIQHLAKETIRALVQEMDDHEDRAEFFQFCALSQQAKMVRNVVSLAASDPRVAVPASELDAQPHLLGVQNGVVNLMTGELLSPAPGYRITLVSACDYNPAAQCPLFQSTALEAFSGNKEMASYFMLTLGYALMGNPTHDVMFIPFGNGSNGKSTLLGVVRKMFGGYARTAEASSFVSDGKSGNAGGAREDLVRLRGARFVYVNEPDENGELREGAVKSMTGGDAITARGLFAKNSVEITPTWVVYMPTNHKPIVKGSDNGIWRRLALIPFERNFDNDPTVVKDPDREEKLLAEMPGVLSLIVRAALRYQQTGLLQPEGVKAARESYRSQMDLLAEWIEECCDIGDFTEEAARLWSSWELFAKNRGILQYVRSSIALGRRLDSRFSAFKGNRGVRMRRGIRLRDQIFPESEADVAGSDLF